jgi:hypothetical protein
MNMPTFTAEASLYKTRGHYQTGRHVTNLPREMTPPIYPAMVATGVNCRNCVGGDCAELHCFEHWTHGGGGGGGPYDGGGGGGDGGGWTCTRDVVCQFNCTDNVWHPCYSKCVGEAGGDFKSPEFAACVKGCDAARQQCVQGCPMVCH